MKLAVLLALLGTACGSDPHDNYPDAPPGQCWPLPSMAGGSVELGTGDGVFAPMPDTLRVTMNSGQQSDAYLEIMSRVHGIPPGDPNDLLSPTNPFTKVNVNIDNGAVMKGMECPARVAYVAASAADTFDIIHTLNVGFGFGFNLGTVDQKQAVITLEVVGSNHLYTSVTKTVTLDASGLY